MNGKTWTVGEKLDAADLDWPTFKLIFGLPFKVWEELRAAKLYATLHSRMDPGPRLEVTAVNRDTRSITLTFKD